MQIVVNHLTRMQPGYICAAGIDVLNRRHVRSMHRGRLRADLLTSNGGPFGIAALVELGAATHCGQAPEVEDYLFDPISLRRKRDISPAQFWALLQHVAHTNILEIFGPSMKPLRRGYVVDVGQGEASLGCLLPAEPPVLYIDHRGTIRAKIIDSNGIVDLSVTDVRLYEIDRWTPKEHLVNKIAGWVKSGAPIILSLGLTRPWKHPDDSVERHWLQLNNIHFKEHFGW